MTGRDTIEGAAVTAPAARAGGELRSIQYLRAVAALAVVVYHAVERGGGHFGTGAAGVDVFFVISGFIMALVGARPGQTPRAFLQRRAERIAPLYWLVTLGVAFLALAAPALFPRMVVTAPHVLQSLFFVPHISPTGEPAPLIVPGWTLNYEAFFYLLFALTLFAPMRLRVWALSALLIGLVALGLLVPMESIVWRTYTSPLLLEFLLGVWLGHAWKAGWTAGRLGGLALMALGLAGFAVAAALQLDVEPIRLLAWGAPAFLLVAGAASLEQSSVVPRWRWLGLLGDASYSIYLVHGLAISAAARLLSPLGMDQGLILVAAALPASVAAGLGCYVLVEKPLLALFRVRQKRAASRARQGATA